MKLIFTLPLFLVLACSRPQSFEQVKRDHPSSFREILDRKGELLHETRIDFKRHRRSWTRLEELSPDFLAEIIQLEDKRFYSHFGVDPWAMVHAVKDYPRRGASTITMQLAGVLNKERGRRSVRAKIGQAYDAVQIERSWSKKRNT